MMNAFRAAALRLLLIVGLASVSVEAQAALACGPAAVPPVAASGLRTVLADAHTLAGRCGGSVVRVAGASMLPYFGDGSVLVVRPSAIERLAAGAVVVYRNRFGEVVAHRLETKVDGGWTVRGANNAATDTSLVTADNLVGSVYATFHSNARGGDEFAGDLAALVSATPVALAAAAR